MVERNSMLGKDFYKTEVNAELSNERLKSLIFFYRPMIGNDALILYQYLVLNGNRYSYSELNELLSRINISVDQFENLCSKLNEYRLLKTLKKDNYYIFIVNEALSMKEFVKDSILVRDFILKTSGEHYQQLIAGLYNEDSYAGFEDVSETLSLDDLNSWSISDEQYFTAPSRTDNYDFNTLFDVNVFLKDISTNLLPMKFRTRDNMKELATLADLYNISYDKMRTFLPRIASLDSDELDLKQLRYLCMRAKNDYQRTAQDQYDVPCLQYLMSLFDGKELTDYDKKIIYNLSNHYHLSAPVINVLLSYCLKNCDNRLIEKYIYAVAADLHRNDITTSEAALQRLAINNNHKDRKEDKIPVYDTSSNTIMSESEEEQLLRLMGRK